MGALIVAGGYVLNGQQVISWGLPIWAWQAIGVVIFALSVLAIVMGFQKRLDATVPTSQVARDNNSTSEQSAPRIVESVEPSKDKESPVRSASGEFLPRRHEYGWFRGHVESASEVWAFWHSGASARNNGLFRTGRIKKLLLVFPNNEETQALADITHVGFQELRAAMFATAKEAKKWGVEVKWWDGHIVPPFTIGDLTRSGSTWVITEYLVPFLDADQRPGDFITDPQVCGRYREAFMEMWNNWQMTQARFGLND